jgi:ABC-type polar amino acid transport system ATPase subunit
MRNVAKTGTSLIVVTPEMGFAQDVADRILFMDGGKILQDAAPKEFFENPNCERVQNFVKKINKN